jgi:iron complex outermembrane receptor protein
LHFENSFSFVRGQFTNDYNGSKNLPFMPQPRLLSELKGEFKKVNKHFKNAYIKLEADNFFAQKNIFTSFNTETATTAYTLVNIGFGADVILHKKNAISVFVGLNNLMDITYQNHLSRLKYTDINNATGRTGVFNMGSNLSLKINVPLSFQLK